MINSDLLYGNTNWKYVLKQFVQSGDFAPFVREVIDETITTYFEPELKGRMLTNFQRTNSPYISWYDEVGAVGADIINDGDEPPRITIKHGKYTVRTYEIGVAFEISRNTLDDSTLDLYTRHLRRAVRSVARRENQYIFTVLVNGVANGTAPRKGDVYSSHIINSTDTDFDNANLDHRKIQYAISVLEDEGYSPTAVVMNPAQYLQLQMLLELRDTNNTFTFLPPDASEMISKGVRKAFGLSSLQVIQDRYIPKDTVLFMDKEEYADFYELRPLSIDDIDDRLRWIYTTSLRERVGAVAREPRAGAKIVNLTYPDITAVLQ